MIDAYRHRAIVEAPFAPATAEALVAAGFETLGDIEAAGDRTRRARLPGLAEGQHHRILAILAEARDDEILLRCRNPGDAA